MIKEDFNDYRFSVQKHEYSYQKAKQTIRKNQNYQNSKSKNKNIDLQPIIRQINIEQIHEQKKQLKKKTKVEKKKQNQAYKILKQRQIKSIFQHICDINGFISIESLGRTMVRYKRPFEMQNLKDMIQFYQNTIQLSKNTITYKYYVLTNTIQSNDYQLKVSDDKLRKKEIYIFSNDIILFDLLNQINPI